MTPFNPLPVLAMFLTYMKAKISVSPMPSALASHSVDLTSKTPIPPVMAPTMRLIMKRTMPTKSSAMTASQPLSLKSCITLFPASQYP